MPTDMMRSDRGQSGAVLVLSQLAALWRQQPRARKLIAAAALLALLVGLGWTSLVERAPAWATVITAHRDEEARECVTALQSKGIAVRARGRDIEVPPATLAQARTVLAAAGLPNSGIGLGVFNDNSFLATGFGEQVSYKRAQQQELARSIKALAPIDDARVHLALGRYSLFKEREQRPSASVSLQLRPGMAISGAQVQGIRQLVVGAVDGMRVDEVAVIDQLGNPLGGDDGVLGVAALGVGGGKRELEREVEAKVRGLLERLVGVGNVEVAVHAEVDLRRVEETAEVYGRERSAITAETRTREAAAGKVGAKATAGEGGAAASGTREGSAGEGEGIGGDGLVRTSATYAPSHVVTETRFPGARLRRLQLAVVVDAGRGGASEPATQRPGELELWGALVRNAAGLDESRGDRLELQVLPFAATPRHAAEAAVAAATGTAEVGIEQRSAERLVAAAVALGALGVLVVLLLRRRYASRLAAAARRAEEAEAQAALSERRAAAVASAMPLGGGGGGVERSGDRGGARGAERSERAGEVVRRDLDGAALVLSAWLAGEEEAAVAQKGHAQGAKGAPS